MCTTRFVGFKKIVIGTHARWAPGGGFGPGGSWRPDRRIDVFTIFFVNFRPLPYLRCERVTPRRRILQTHIQMQTLVLDWADGHHHHDHMHYPPSSSPNTVNLHHHHKRASSRSQTIPHYQQPSSSFAIIHHMHLHPSSSTSTIIIHH